MRAPLLLRTLRFEEIGFSLVLLIQVATMFVIAPLAASGLMAPVTIDVFRFGLAAVAVILVTRNRLFALAIAATFVVSLILSLAWRTGPGSTVVYLYRLAITTGFDLAVAAAVAHAAFGPGRVTVHRILGAVILYLSIGLVFASAYRACAVLLQPSFSGLPANRRAALSQLLYFSLSTLTTTGFGDILPLHPFVRSLANLEAVIGQLFPATLLARLVTLHASRGQAERTPGAVESADRPGR